MNDLQKANIWKRLSAYLFDGILLIIAAVGFGWLMSLVCGMNARAAELEAVYEEYETRFDIDLEKALEEYAELDDETRARFDAAEAAMNADETLTALYNRVLNGSVLVVSLGLLLAFLLIELALPLIFGDGRTLGKKIFGLGVMQQNCVRIRPAAVFVRGILGKYALETMLPLAVLFMVWAGGMNGIALLLPFGLLLVNAGMLVSGKGVVVHDLMAYTVAVDLASQRIFDTPEAADAFAARQAEKRRQEEEYGRSLY